MRTSTLLMSWGRTQDVRLICARAAIVAMCVAMPGLGVVPAFASERPRVENVRTVEVVTLPNPQITPDGNGNGNDGVPDGNNGNGNGDGSDGVPGNDKGDEGDQGNGNGNDGVPDGNNGNGNGDGNDGTPGNPNEDPDGNGNGNDGVPDGNNGNGNGEGSDGVPGNDKGNQGDGNGNDGTDPLESPTPPTPATIEGFPYGQGFPDGYEDGEAAEVERGEKEKPEKGGTGKPEQGGEGKPDKGGEGKPDKDGEGKPDKDGEGKQDKGAQNKPDKDGKGKGKGLDIPTFSGGFEDPAPDEPEVSVKREKPEGEHRSKPADEPQAYRPTSSVPSASPLPTRRAEPVGTGAETQVSDHILQWGSPERMDYSFDVGRAAVVATRTFAFPLALAVGVLLFLVIQGQVDRRDPKLTGAPVRDDTDEVFFE